jgi:hypothetical protein
MENGGREDTCGDSFLTGLFVFVHSLLRCLYQVPGPLPEKPLPPQLDWS